MANYWFKFEWDDWRNDPQLRRCCKETKGFWIDCIAAMEDLSTYFLQGTKEEICRDIVATSDEFDRSISELIRTGAATILIGSQKNGEISVKNLHKISENNEIVKIVSRRLLKKSNLTEYNRLKKRESRSRMNVKVNVKAESRASSKDKSLEFKDLDSPIGEVHNTPEREKSEPKIMLPSDFQVTEEMRQWAAEHAPDMDVDAELDEFKTFWREIATKNHRRTGRGWNATWKNRMKDRQEYFDNLRQKNGTNPKDGKSNLQVSRERDYSKFDGLDPIAEFGTPKRG